MNEHQAGALRQEAFASPAAVAPPLLPQRVGQPNVLTISETHGLEAGHWYSPAAVAAMIASAAAVAQAEPVAAARLAPWSDFLGQPIHEGDVLLHPQDGDEFRALYDDARDDEALRWRAVYGNGESLWLGNQIGDKGRAVLAAPPQPLPAQGAPGLLHDAILAALRLTLEHVDEPVAYRHAILDDMGRRLELLGAAQGAPEAMTDEQIAKLMGWDVEFMTPKLVDDLPQRIRTIIAARDAQWLAQHAAARGEGR